MAMLAIDVPQNISGILKRVYSSANEPNPHITLFHLGDSVSTDELFKIIPIIKEYVSSCKPFEITCSEIFSFDKGEFGYPVVVKIESNKLMKLRGDLKELFDKKKIKYSNNYPDFKPHLTLTYSDKKQESEKIDEISWIADELSLYTGSQDHPDLYVSFPINVKEIKASTKYVLAAAAKYLIKTKTG